MPNSPLRNQFELIAYRGGAAERPENTMEAFSHALSLSAHLVIDLDLQFAKDQTVVVIHDDTLDRTTNGSGPVSDYSMTELKQLDAGFHFLDASGEHAFRGKGVNLPTLEEVFGEYPETRFILDIRKNDSKHIERIIQTVEAANASDRVIVVSELDEVINTSREFRPDWIYGAPTNEVRMVVFGSQSPVSPVFMIPESYKGVQVLSAELLRKLHQHGTQAWIWTVDEPDAFLRLKEMGVDGIFTNKPQSMMSQFG